MIPLLAAVVMVGTGQPTFAQTQDPGATELDEITVEGRRTAAVVRGFLGEVAAPSRNRGLARWPHSVCVGAVNLRAETAQFLIDRVSMVVADIGLASGEPGCEPNVLVLATDHADEVADYLVGAHRRMMEPGGSGMTRGRDALDAFRSSSQPVRWWHVSMPVDAETGARAARLPGDDGPITISKFAASRLQSALRDDLRKVVIVVDVNKLQGRSFAQLADYVAMISLTQIDPDADTSQFDTILNAFSQADGPTCLTGWDMDYLRALYRTVGGQENVGMGNGVIADQMVRERRAQSDTPACAGG